MPHGKVAFVKTALSITSQHNATQQNANNVLHCVAVKPFMQSVVQLSVVLLNFVALFQVAKFLCTFSKGFNCSQFASTIKNF
jgi:hypothetical protein